MPSAAPITQVRDNFRPTVAQTTPANPFSNLISQAKTLVQQPRVGPRGFTINDVARVAAGDFQPPTPPPVLQVPEIDFRAVLQSLVGGPAETYGQQYAGLPSAGYFQAQVRGDTINALTALRMAGEEAARLGAEAQGQYDVNINPTVAGSMAAEQLARNQRILETPLSTLALQLSGGRRNPAGQISREDMYAANMARTNALRGTGDYNGASLDQLRTVQAGIEDGMEPPSYWGQGMIDRADALRFTPGESQGQLNARAMAVDAAKQQMANDLVTSGATSAAELANLIGSIAASDLMQQFAVQRYGYDPGLAAGLFPMSEDLYYENLLIDAYNAQMMRETGVDPNATVAELILKNYGVEGLERYQDQQSLYALEGTPSQMLAAQQNEMDVENAMFDESVRTKYGFDPGRVSGIEPDYVRNLVMNPDFTSIFEDARRDVLQGGYPLEVASRRASEYLSESNDALGARALGEIIASFDLRSFE
jgi:hypothetical protein